ncbi:MAG: signal recognition particle-docking protein FtsY [Planctomycetes bacterium]|nr:signal recognition particle-docking protein FtsY [Planctomycetota bacterium]
MSEEKSGKGWFGWISDKLFGGISSGLKKTQEKLHSVFKTLVGKTIDRDILDSVLEVLIEADISPVVAEALVSELEANYKRTVIESEEQLTTFLKEKLKEQLASRPCDLIVADKPPTVILIVGVNGSGKTTSIAKLAWLLREDGKKVMIGACDTFRAAAVEQLRIWAERTGSLFETKGQGADPAAVAFSATEKAIEQGVDVLILDTAGRLHTNKNLMAELSKIKRVVAKKIPEAPHECLMIVDGTTGQNALVQAMEFKKATDVTGLFVTKLDGTAKGGVVIRIHREIDIPVKFIGVGEKMENIKPFDAGDFVEALFSTA